MLRKDKLNAKFLWILMEFWSFGPLFTKLSYLNYLMRFFKFQIPDKLMNKFMIVESVLLHYGLKKICMCINKRKVS